MRTNSMPARRRLGLLASGLAMSVHFLASGTAVAEEDHLKGYKIKDLNKVAAAANQYTLSNQFGTETCDLKKPKFFLVQSEKNSGDDPRGGPAGRFVCYKAKCTGALPPPVAGDSQLGDHLLKTKKAKLVCLPFNEHVCGDGGLDPGETCDGSADAACPGLCQADCTCPPQECGNNVREGGEACDGTDDANCPNFCEVDCTCPDVCPDDDGPCIAYGTSTQCTTCCDLSPSCQSECTLAANQTCQNAANNLACNAASISAGCATECCPNTP